jgi:hypothetical protein
MINNITLAWSTLKDLPIDQKPKLEDVIKQKLSSIYSVSTHCIYIRFDRQRLDVQQIGRRKGYRKMLQLVNGWTNELEADLKNMCTVV